MQCGPLSAPNGARPASLWLVFSFVLKRLVVLVRGGVQRVGVLVWNVLSVERGRTEQSLIHKIAKTRQPNAHTTRRTRALNRFSRNKKSRTHAAPPALPGCHRPRQGLRGAASSPPSVRSISSMLSLAGALRLRKRRVLRGPAAAAAAVPAPSPPAAGPVELPAFLSSAAPCSWDTAKRSVAQQGPQACSADLCLLLCRAGAGRGCWGSVHLGVVELNSWTQELSKRTAAPARTSAGTADLLRSLLASVH